MAEQRRPQILLSQTSPIHRARIIPVFLALIVLAATVALKLGVGRSDAAVTAVSPTMHASVRPNNDITLTFDDGSSVGSQDRVTPTIPAGTYVVRVLDDASEHNFHLLGPGVEQATGIGESGTPTWTVTFQAGGTYRFVCDTHTDFMFGLFQASSAAGGSGGGSSSGGSSGGSSSGGSSSGGSSSSGGVSSNTLTTVGTLAVAVTSTGKPKLTFKGKSVTKLKAGRYKVSVDDKSKTSGFIIQQLRKSATTLAGVSWVGKQTVTITLKAGQWTFYTSAGSRSKSAFSVVA